MMYYWNNGGSWGGMALSMVFWTLLLAAIVFAAVWIGRSHERAAAMQRGGSAAVILDGRLARGEIAEAEYREKKNLLG